jgi:8-oxo-dGTP pyrophosphatase MutT (NUDIX family)
MSALPSSILPGAFAGWTRTSGPEPIIPGHEWQCPQGGIDPGEGIVAAARRELWGGRASSCIKG